MNSDEKTTISMRFMKQQGPVENHIYIQQFITQAVKSGNMSYPYSLPYTTVYYNIITFSFEDHSLPCSGCRFPV